MKHIKRFENIEWDNWDIEEENKEKINFKYHIKNDIPIKVYNKDWFNFLNDLKKNTSINLNNFTEYIEDRKYLYIYLYDKSYLSPRSIESYIENGETTIYNIDKVVIYEP